MPFLPSQDGTNLYYNDCGSGKPILLVHGWSINSDSWEYMTGCLCRKGYRCITYDLRGCGRSEKPWEGYDFATLCDDLACIIEKLHLSDLTLVGHSMGCGIICQYLAGYGELAVSRVVLIGTTTPYITRADDNPNGADPDIFESALQAMRADRPAYVRSMANGFFNLPANGSPISPSLVDWGVNLALQASARASEELYRTSFFTDQRFLLTRVSVPCSCNMEPGI